MQSRTYLTTALRKAKRFIGEKTSLLGTRFWRTIYDVHVLKFYPRPGTLTRQNMSIASYIGAWFATLRQERAYQAG